MSDKEPDPVAVRAAHEAVEATNPKKHEHVWLRKTSSFIGIVILILGAASLILSAINAVKLANQNEKLAAQQLCLAQLLVRFEEDQAYRLVVAADDRKAVDDMVHAISSAVATHHPERIPLAFKRYNQERVANDNKRAHLGNSPTLDKCFDLGIGSPALPNTTPSAKNSSLATPPVPPTPKTTVPGKRTRTTTPTSIPRVSTSPGTSSDSKGRTTNPKPAPNPQPTVTVTKTAPAPTTPAPSPSSTGILHPVCQITLVPVC